jgi:hypothetical protein
MTGKTLMTNTPAAIMKELRKVHIRTKREAALKEMPERLFEEDDAGNLTHEPVRFIDDSQTHGIAFIEGSGGGETTAIRKTLKAFEPLADNPETGQPRWLQVKVESPATLRSLGVDMLKKLGIDHVADRTKVYEIWYLVRRRLRILGVTLVWIDEAQDMFKETMAAETQSMFKMLKGLMQGDHPVVVVLSGTDRLKEITGLDPQVNRRFSKICPPQLEFATDNELIEAITGAYAKKAGLKLDVSGETINRIIRAGRHRFGRCIYLILKAVEAALHDKASKLTIEHFELAYGTERAARSRPTFLPCRNGPASSSRTMRSSHRPRPLPNAAASARRGADHGALSDPSRHRRRMPDLVFEPVRTVALRHGAA